MRLKLIVTVVVVGQDVDLIILISQFGHDIQNSYILKENKPSTSTLYIFANNGLIYTDLITVIVYTRF